jgi:hypothetical protein
MTTLALGLGGAEQRLLAEPVPALFFGLAVLAHLPAWGGLALVAEQLPWFTGGPGLTLAILHLLTVGVLLSTAMGASLQMLPVALGRPAPPVGLCLATFAVLAPGLGLLTAGFATVDVRLLTTGAAGLVIAVLLYTWAIARIVAAPPLGALKIHAGAAGGFLLVAVSLAGLLVLDYQIGFFADHARIALVHALCAGFGYMGTLVLGFSPVLLPMFAVAEATEDTPLAIASGLCGLALGIALDAALLGQATILAAAAALALAGSALHMGVLARTLAKRMRRRLGPEFLFVRAAWAFLAAALVALLLLALGQLAATGPALVLVLLLYGWLLTLLLGVLQRILPFLASMHAARRRARPLVPTRLVAERALALHRLCHFAALAALVAGVLLALPWAIRTAAAIGLIGAAAFAWFAATVALRARRHIDASRPQTEGSAR